MAEEKKRRKKPGLFWIIGAIAVIVVLALTVTGLVVTQAAPAQPFPFNHAAHADKGIPCLYCHSGAFRGEFRRSAHPSAVHGLSQQYQG